MKAEGTIKPANFGFQLLAAEQFLFRFLTTNYHLHGSQLAVSSGEKARTYLKALRDTPRVCVWLEWLLWWEYLLPWVL